MKRSFRSLFLFVMMLCAFTQLAQAEGTGKRLHIPWPEGWQLTEPQIQQSAMHQNARLQKAGKTVIDLKLTAINLSHGPKPPDLATVKQLATNLRDAVAPTATEKNLPLQAFDKAQGYYFVATDKQPKPGEFTQMMEGVILQDSYLINFTLLTNDIEGADAQAMASALNQLNIN